MIYLSIYQITIDFWINYITSIEKQAFDEIILQTVSFTNTVTKYSLIFIEQSSY